MNEQTNPSGGVAQEATIEERASAYASQLLGSQGGAEDEPQPQEGSDPAETPKQTEGQANEELTPDDLEVEQGTDAQPAAETVFEIVHNGETHKIASREEQIRYIQQGFDYTQKTQAVAEKDRAVSDQLRVLAEVNQAQPYLMQERAQVAAIEQQLGRYQNFNWVQLATDDPMGYPAARAQYDVLVQAHQHARGQYSQKEAAVGQHLQAVVEKRRAQENLRLPDLIPEWKDPAKRQAGEAEIAKHYTSAYGISFEELNAHLGGAVSVAVVYKAMKYDQLLKGKADKVKQLRTSPPVTVPGAKSTTASADKDKELRTNLRKTGDRYDAAAVLLNRMK